VGVGFIGNEIWMIRNQSLSGHKPNCTNKTFCQPFQLIYHTTCTLSEPVKPLLAQNRASSLEFSPPDNSDKAVAQTSQSDLTRGSCHSERIIHVKQNYACKSLRALLYKFGTSNTRDFCQFRKAKCQLGLVPAFCHLQL